MKWLAATFDLIPEHPPGTACLATNDASLMLRKLAGQTAVYGLSTILGRLLNLFLTPLFTDKLGQLGYGVISRLYSGVTFANVVVTFGMETTFFRFLQDEESPQKIYNHAFAWVAAMGSLLLLLCVLFRHQLAQWVDYPGAESLVIMIAGIIFLDALAALPLAKLRHEEKALRFSLINLGNILVSVGLNYLFLDGMDKGVAYVFVANLIASAIRLSLALWGNLPTSLRLSWPQLRGMLDYGFFIMIAGFAGTMNETLDRLIMKDLWGDCRAFRGEFLTGDELTGIYAANYKVAMLIVLFTQAYRYAAEPFFFKESKKKDSPETFARVFHYFTLSTLLGFLVLSSFAKEVVSFDFFGLVNRTFVDEAFWSGLEVVPILLLAYVLNGIYINISIWYKITKQTRFALLFTGTGALCTILVNLLTIPTMGYMGSAWATLLCYLLMSVMVYALGQRYYPVPYRMGRMLMYALLFFLCYLINQQIGPTDGYWPAFAMKAFVCLAVVGTLFVVEKAWPISWKREA